MGSVMEGLSGDSFDKEYKGRELFKKYMQRLSGKYRRITWLVILLIINTVVGIAIPLLTSKSIDQLSAVPLRNNAIWVAAGIAILNVSSWLLNRFQKKHSKQVVAELTCELQQDCFNSSMDKDMSFFARHSSGKILSRITGDTEAMSNAINLVTGFFGDVFVFTGLMMVVFVINPTMSLILCTFIPLIVFVALGFRRIARVVSTRLYQAIAEVNSSIKECLCGTSVTKNFRQEDYMYKKFLKVNETAYQTNITQGLVFSAILPLMNTLSSLGVSVIVYCGAMRVMGGKLSFGELYLFIQAAGLIWGPVSSISSFWSQFQEGLAASARVFSLLEEENRVVQKDNIAEPIKGEIEIKDLTMAYYRERFNGEGQLQQERNIFHKFSLHIKAGEKIALVGDSGAGKTTLIRVIMRFYKFQKGRVLIDGINIKRLDLENYRKYIGYVGQTPFLFSGTVLENIVYGNSELTEETAKEKIALDAANMIGDGEWLKDLQKGLYTEIGERGSKLSAGQRQLVMLARAFAKNPSILILDEATANIDPFTEHQIQEAISTLMEGRTCIIVAHRLATIMAADRILVLKKGKIKEEGTHEQLLEQGAYYKDIYDRYFWYQSREFIEQNPDELAEGEDTV